MKINQDIHVTQEDIDKARAALAAGGRAARGVVCPIAQALRRQGFPDARVGISYMLTAAGRCQCDLPEEAQMFVYDFDTRDRAEPFTFHLECEFPDGPSME